MKISRAKRQVNYVGDSRDQECRAFFEKPSRNGIRVGLLVGQLNRILELSNSEAGLKVEKSWGIIEEEGECGDANVELSARERRSSDILFVKKEARLSARSLAEVEVGLV